MIKQVWYNKTLSTDCELYTFFVVMDYLGCKFTRNIELMIIVLIITKQYTRSVDCSVIFQKYIFIVLFSDNNWFDRKYFYLLKGYIEEARWG